MNRIQPTGKIDERQIRLMSDAIDTLVLCNENILAVSKALLSNGQMIEDDLLKVMPHPEFADMSLCMMEDAELIRRWDDGPDE